MLNSGKKMCTLRDKKINIITLVLSEKKFRNETKNHNPPPPPPLQVKWSVPYIGIFHIYFFKALLINEGKATRGKWE